MSQAIRFLVTVEEVTRHSPDLLTCRLYSDKRLPRFEPGQFVHLTLEPYDPADFWPESRIFSVANAVVDRRTIMLTIGRKGEYTSKILSMLTPKDRLWVKGPYGDFTIDTNNYHRHAIFIAGGTGITPFCSFMDSVLAKGELPIEHIALHYGAQKPALLIYRKLTEHYAAELPGFQVHYYSDHQPDEDDVAIQTGQIDINVIMSTLKKPEISDFYLSGPKSMIDVFRDSLVNNHGLMPDQVHIDAWE
jgi:ferredoxin-NADP reductase